MESLRARVIDIETRRSDAMTASRCDTDRRMNLDDVLWPGALSTGAMAAMAAGGVSVGSHVGDARCCDRCRDVPSHRRSAACGVTHINALDPGRRRRTGSRTAHFHVAPAQNLGDGRTVCCAAAPSRWWQPRLLLPGLLVLAPARYHAGVPYSTANWNAQHWPVKRIRATRPRPWQAIVANVRVLRAAGASLGDAKDEERHWQGKIVQDSIWNNFQYSGPI